MKKNLLLLLTTTLLKFANAQTNAGTILANHTDLNPDTLMHYVYNPYTHQIFDLSVFTSTPEIEFVADGSSSPGGSSAYISIRSLMPFVSIMLGRLDSVFDSTSSSWLVTKVAKPLSAGDRIDAPGATWDSNLQYISDHSASFGWTKNVNDWIGSDKYVGLKYDDGSATAYGWIHLQCVAKDSCYIKEFSSNSPASFIRQFSNEKPTVSPNPSKDKFSVLLHQNAGICELQLYSMNGICIWKKQTAGERKEEVILRDQPQGIYTLHVLSDSANYFFKIVKE